MTSTSDSAGATTSRVPGGTSRTTEHPDDRREVAIVLAHEDVVDSQPVAEHPELFDQVVDGADEHVRRLEDVSHGQLDSVAPANSIGDFAGGGFGLIRDLRRKRWVGVDLELVGARGLSDDGNLRFTARQRPAKHVSFPGGANPRRDPDNIGIACGESKQLWATATNEERRMRALDGTREGLEARPPVETALEVSPAIGKKTLHDAYRLGQPIDSDGAGIVWDFGALLPRPFPTRAA